MKKNTLDHFLRRPADRRRAGRKRPLLWATVGLGIAAAMALPPLSSNSREPAPPPALEDAGRETRDASAGWSILHPVEVNEIRRQDKVVRDAEALAAFEFLGVRELSAAREKDPEFLRQQAEAMAHLVFPAATRK